MSKCYIGSLINIAIYFDNYGLRYPPSGYWLHTHKTKHMINSLYSFRFLFIGANYFMQAYTLGSEKQQVLQGIL